MDARGHPRQGRHAVPPRPDRRDHRRREPRGQHRAGPQQRAVRRRGRDGVRRGLGRGRSTRRAAPRRCRRRGRRRRATARRGRCPRGVIPTFSRARCSARFSGVGPGLHPVRRRVPEEQVDQLPLRRGADAASAVRRPAARSRCIGLLRAVVGSPPLPDPADHADQLAVGLDGQRALLVEPARRRRGEPGRAGRSRRTPPPARSPSRTRPARTAAAAPPRSWRHGSPACRGRGAGARPTRGVTRCARWWHRFSCDLL